jgi:hypothetical protein
MLAGVRAVEVQVSEMEQAKGHKSPMSTRNEWAAMALTGEKQRPL